MNILDEIAAHKRKETAENKSLYPVKLLERSIFFNSKPVSLREYVLRADKEGIIAEFKRKSPSKGVFHEEADIEKLSIKYMIAGASALSVLTDHKYFSGSNEDLRIARKYNYCPILRKDFIIDEYQVIEAKSIGADAILLIGAVLTKAEVKQFAAKARELGMEVLYEVHDRCELDKLNEYIDLVGVNNRNLKDFSVDVQNSVEIGKSIPGDYVKISESGISKAETIIELREHGFKGFLIGESFMKASHPARECAKLIQRIKTLKQPA